MIEIEVQKQKRYKVFLKPYELRNGMIVQVAKLYVHGEEHFGDLHDYTSNMDLAPWAIVQNDSLIWLKHDWAPEFLESIKDGEFLEMVAGDVITLRKV